MYTPKEENKGLIEYVYQNVCWLLNDYGLDIRSSWNSTSWYNLINTNLYSLVARMVDYGVKDYNIAFNAVCNYFMQHNHVYGNHKSFTEIFNKKPNRPYPFYNHNGDPIRQFYEITVKEDIEYRDKLNKKTLILK